MKTPWHGPSMIPSMGVTRYGLWAPVEWHRNVFDRWRSIFMFEAAADRSVTEIAPNSSLLGWTIVCYTAVFCVVTQRSSPLSGDERCLALSDMGFVLAQKLSGTVNTPPQLRHESTGCKTGSRRTVFFKGAMWNRPFAILLVAKLLKTCIWQLQQLNSRNKNNKTLKRLPIVRHWNSFLSSVGTKKKKLSWLVPMMKYVLYLLHNS